MKHILWVAVLAGAYSANTLAQDHHRQGAVTVTPAVNWAWFNDDLDLEKALMGSLALGYNVTSKIAVETSAAFGQAETLSSNADADITIYRAAVTYRFDQQGNWVPHVKVGLGGIEIDSDNAAAEDDTLFDLGFGLDYALSENTSLTFDYTHSHALDAASSYPVLGLGIQRQFGGAKSEVVEPAPAPAPAEPVKGDADNDSVFDESDKCPETPAGVTVDADGCPLDSDKDLVPDYKDKCPDTPMDAKVDADGCNVVLQEEVRSTLNVTFANASAVLAQESYEEVEALGLFLRQYPDTVVVLEGHTDNVGSESYNLKLSDQRAEAVKLHLQQHANIAAERITFKGFGESQPVADNKTAEGRQQNRRVVAVVNAVKTTIQKRD